MLFVGSVMENRRFDCYLFIQAVLICWALRLMELLY
jgi:hypothetical protein